MRSVVPLQGEGRSVKIIRPRISRLDAVPGSEFHYRIVTSDPVECKDWELRWDLVVWGFLCMDDLPIRGLN